MRRKGCLVDEFCHHCRLDDRGAVRLQLAADLTGGLVATPVVAIMVVVEVMGTSFGGDHSRGGAAVTLI
jgi:hypothetical protein